MNKLCSSVLVILIGCLSLNIAAAQQNTLTEKEKQEGWKLLFNGKDLQGWHSYLQKEPGNGWQVKDGAIFINEDDKSADNTDLTSDE
jgi:hypothetical protein